MNGDLKKPGDGNSVNEEATHGIPSDKKILKEGKNMKLGTKLSENRKQTTQLKIFEILFFSQKNRDRYKPAPE